MKCSASQGVHDCVCFQRSAYKARSATQCAALHSAQRAALHSAQRFTARSASQRPALHCAQRFTAPSVAQCATLYNPSSPLPPALHSAQHCTAPSTTLHRAQRAKTRPNAATELSRKPVAQRGLLRFLCSISAHENRSADTRARSLCLERLGSIFGALGTPGKPNRDVPRNALLCSFLFLFYGTLVRSYAWPSFDFLCRMIT